VRLTACVGSIVSQQRGTVSSSPVHELSKDIAICTFGLEYCIEDRHVGWGASNVATVSSGRLGDRRMGSGGGPGPGSAS